MLKQQYKNTDYADGRCWSNISHKFLTPKQNTPYPTYHLKIENKSKTIKIHRMVAETFLSNPQNKPFVNHIDGNTHNYHLSNLEWVNAQHAYGTGLKKPTNQEPIWIEDNLLLNEIWVNIPEFESYQVSSFGRVKRENRLLRLYLDKGGYPCVSLWKDKKGHTFQIHRIVYKSFYSKQNLSGLVINHINGNKTNNFLENLEAISYKENNLHAIYQIKTNKSAKTVYLNKEVIKEFPSIAKATRQTGITNISRAIKFNYRTCDKYYWKFKES